MGKDIVATGPEGGSVYGCDYPVNIDTGSVERYPVENDCCNHSSLREGFASIMEAVEDVCQGKMVIVVGDEGRETKGFLVLAASLISHEVIDFLVKHGTGIVYVTMTGKDLDRLQLRSMDAQHEVPSSFSACDMATTILALASRQPDHEDMIPRCPIFLRKYREGGVLERTGHTEAAVDLAMLAGVEPIGVSCELVTGAGSRERLIKLHEFASNENLKIISIADLVRHRRMNDKLVEVSASARMPTQWGTFIAHCYRSVLDGIEHVAMVKGEIGDGQDVLVRVHSECLTGDIFGSARCDCGNQLALAMQLIERAGRGVLVYNRGHEGRGIGLGNKLRAYNLQDAGLDTVDANIKLGLPVDSREYHISAQILKHLGVQSIRLLTNNPAKCVQLKSLGLAIVDRIPVITTITKENERYLETKRAKMSHMFDLGFGSFNGENGKNSCPSKSNSSPVPMNADETAR